MDFSWAPYFTGFWIFPLLCLLFMVIMMVGCRAMSFRCGHGGGQKPEEHKPDALKP